MVLKNLLLYTNDFLALFVMKLTIITVISIQIYALIKVKSLKKKYYIFLFIKILEIIFFKYEIFYELCQNTRDSSTRRVLVVR